MLAANWKDKILKLIKESNKCNNMLINDRSIYVSLGGGRNIEWKRRVLVYSWKNVGLLDQRITLTIIRQEGAIGEKLKNATPEQLSVLSATYAPAEISYDGIKGWVSRLSIGFGGMHCFEGISNMAWKGPLCLPLLSLCYRLSPSCTRWHGRRLAGRVLTVAALTPLAHSLGSGSHDRRQGSTKLSRWEQFDEAYNYEIFLILYFFNVHALYNISRT